MTQDNSQVPWTDEQWARVNQVIQEEANRARVAATFLPLFGPLPPEADFVRANVIGYGTPAQPRMTTDDVDTIPLATLQVKVFLRGAQMSDLEMTSALQMFRRAANMLARLEDAVVFRGLTANNRPPPDATRGLQPVWEILGGQPSAGLLPDGTLTGVSLNGDQLVSNVSDGIGMLEARGHFGPFAVVLDQKYFVAVQTPNAASLVLPQDRIIPFLGGGSLLRSSSLPDHSGVVVALGGAPIELVIATDVSVNFLQVTQDPMFVFRVFEKMALRIKEGDAIMRLGTHPIVNSVTPNRGPVAGGTNVTITGSNFTGATAVKFGTNDATDVTVSSATSITATSPPGSAGKVNIAVVTPRGTSDPSAADEFTYSRH
jgi:uncharacterized linocin/CFP29 family protein